MCSCIAMIGSACDMEASVGGTGEELSLLDFARS